MKTTPTYSLDDLKQLLADSSTRIITQRDRSEAASLGYADDDEMVNRVILLTPAEFHKSMESEKRPGLWQDVYKSTEMSGDRLYIKLQISFDGKGVIVSFKKA